MSTIYSNTVAGVAARVELDQQAHVAVITMGTVSVRASTANDRWELAKFGSAVANVATGQGDGFTGKIGAVALAVTVASQGVVEVTLGPAKVQVQSGDDAARLNLAHFGGAIVCGAAQAA
jgi:hypothetical protein